MSEQNDGVPLSPEDDNAIMLMLMKLDATLERIERLLEDEEDGEEEPEP